MARKGARVVLEPREGADRPRRPEDRGGRGEDDGGAWQPEVWVPDPPGRTERGKPRKATPGAGRRTDAVARPGAASKPVEPSTRGPAATPAAREERRLAEAAKAYEADRYADARRNLRPLLERGDASPAVHELHGLTLYRLGKWKEAIAELSILAANTGSLDQHPVIADCQRALKNWNAVEELWEEIRLASPSPEVVAEGRIVAAGALADQGNISAALRLLERAPSKTRRPDLHHLRLWYAKADLLERAGEIPRARELFRTILRHDPDFVDAAERLSALG